MVLINASRGCLVFTCDGGCHAYHLAHHPRGPLQTHGSKRDVGDADVASSQEEVVDISGIETPVGDSIGRLLDINSDRAERVVLELRHVFRIRNMQVHAPRGCHARIGKSLTVEDILLSEHNIAKQTTRLALAGDVSYPAHQTKVLVLRLIDTRILLVCPIA